MRFLGLLHSHSFSLMSLAGNSRAVCLHHSMGSPARFQLCVGWTFQLLNQVQDTQLSKLEWEWVHQVVKDSLTVVAVDVGANNQPTKGVCTKFVA